MALISEVFAVFFVMAFLADRLPLFKSMRKIAEINKLSASIMGSKAIADSDKQKLLLTNSGAIFMQSLKLTGLIFLVLAVGLLLVLSGSFFGLTKAPVLVAYLETITGIVVSVLSFGSYFLIKKIYDRPRV